MSFRFCPHNTLRRIIMLNLHFCILAEVKEIGWQGVYWIGLARGRDNWPAVVNTVLNSRVYSGHFLATWGTVSFSRSILLRGVKCVRACVCVGGLCVCVCVCVWVGGWVCVILYGKGTDAVAMKMYGDVEVNHFELKCCDIPHNSNTVTPGENIYLYGFISHICCRTWGAVVYWEQWVGLRVGRPRFRGSNPQRCQRFSLPNSPDLLWFPSSLPTHGDRRHLLCRWSGRKWSWLVDSILAPRFRKCMALHKYSPGVSKGKLHISFTFVPCILILSKFYLFTNWFTNELSLKIILKFTLKQLQHFDVWLTVHLSIFISVINQPDAQNVCFTVSLFHASTCFEHMCSSSGCQNCITQPLVSSHRNKWVV